MCIRDSSRTLDTVGRLEIGLQFAGCELSSLAFFSSGSTCDLLYWAGNFPVCSDMLASLAMAGVNTCAHDFSNEHGRTSSGDDLDGMPDNSFRLPQRSRHWLK